MAALRTMVISAASTAERQLYRAIAAMTLGLRNSQRLWGTPTKLSALYRMWRQVLENNMHTCVMAWMVQQRSEKEDARQCKFFLMAKSITGPHQCNWFFMAKALVSVLATGNLHAVSRWATNAKLVTHFKERVAARAWATPGVCKLLEQYQRRAVRAHSALKAMSAMGSKRGSGHNGGEFFPPTEGEHDTHSEDSDSGSTLSQEHSEAVYAQRMRDTAAAVRHSTSVAVLSATWKIYKARRWVAVARGALPTAKGIRRYRSLARKSKMAGETGCGELRRSGPKQRTNPTNVTTTVMRGETVIGKPIHGPEPGLVTVFASTNDGQRRPTNSPQPGTAECPIQVSDSDETTLADDGHAPELVTDEETISDSDLTESDEELLLPTVVMQAQQLVAASSAQRAARGGDPQDHPHQAAFKTALLQLSKRLDTKGSYQQVTVRFNTESQASWEARGAAMLEVYGNYSNAMKARLNSPHQEDGKWRRFGNAYVQVLALLQLDTTLVHELWPSTCGGETHFRSMWRTQIKQWLRSAKLRAAELHDERVKAMQLLPDGATAALRNSAIEEAKRHWCFMYDAMHSLCSPTVAMAAAKAALRFTATH